MYAQNLRASNINAHIIQKVMGIFKGISHGEMRRLPNICLWCPQYSIVFDD